jgi:hypothetical protein
VPSTVLFPDKGLMAMRSVLVRSLTLVASGLVLAGPAGNPAAAQGSGSSRLNQPAPARPAPNYGQPQPGYVQPAPASTQPQPAPARALTAEEFYQSLWRYMVREKSPYTRWPSLPGKAGPRKAESPHGPIVRTYANAVAAADPKGLPYGSILVLEDFAADQKTRTGINILYRVKGYDPRNGDWYWMKYLENGTVVRTPADQGGKPVAGRVVACIDCHRKAGGNDFVVSNDEAVAPPETPVEKAQK